MSRPSSRTIRAKAIRDVASTASAGCARTPNLPGTYVVLRDRPENLSPDERRQALEVVEALRKELARR